MMLPGREGAFFLKLSIGDLLTSFASESACYGVDDPAPQLDKGH